MKIDTPETDDLARGNHVVPTEWARDLERERDKWKRMYEEADWRTVEAEVFKRERDDLKQVLRGLAFFCAEDQAFATKAYAKTYQRALELLGQKHED